MSGKGFVLIRSLVDGRVWTVVYGPGCFSWYDTVMYKIDGDTIIEAETYKRCLFGSGDAWTEVSFLREDTEKQQVWIRDVNSFEDKLLFDFLVDFTKKTHTKIKLIYLPFDFQFKHNNFSFFQKIKG